jgi:hypothetical protein
MRFRFRALCPYCGYAWDGPFIRFDCGWIDFERPESYRSYFCPGCLDHLCVPRELSRRSYLRWVYQNAAETTRAPLDFRACELGVMVDPQSLDVIARSPLLFKACERVARVLGETNWPYVAVPIDIGAMACPDCGDAMCDGSIETTALVCPRCEGASATAFGEEIGESARVAYHPLDDDVVRAIIDHLEALAGRSARDRSEWILCGPEAARA